jgi:3'-phosphoadenosine 5'-phosphosulfate sulfotransferase (PAPS reductase)/FAD synthetase
VPTETTPRPLPVSPAEAKNPYRVEPPCLISFSGGRTSGYMLWHILEAHGGALPEGVHVTFANTGKERPETLAFVHEVETRWPVRVRWLEYRYIDNGHTYAEMDYATASRQGEPFAQLVSVKTYLPNPVMRFCTTELKVRVMKKFMLAQGIEEWDSVIGLRADEPSRVHRAKLSCAKERWNNVMPMATAGATLADVMGFWRRQPFDLQLEQHEGNCDLCFLKSTAKIERILRDHPESADRPRYANLLKIIQEQPTLPFGGDHEYDVCNCTD